MTNDLDLPDTRRALILMRSAHGFDSKIGRRCSNILEMMEAGARPVDITGQVAELSSLISKGES